MAHRDAIDSPASVLLEADDTLAPLLAARPVRTATALPEAVVGELIGFVDDGLTPLVRYPGQPGTAALRARCVPDLHGAHVGREVLLSFEGGDPQRPIVTGVLRGAATPPAEATGQVQVDVDGERLVVRAANQLVLQCGEASITLTKAGKVLIQGTYVSSRSSGVNRVHGGSVQLN
jgi:hypothetical protein